LSRFEGNKKFSQLRDQYQPEWETVKGNIEKDLEAERNGSSALAR
jgi:hypothetical protein